MMALLFRVHVCLLSCLLVKDIPQSSLPFHRFFYACIEVDTLRLKFLSVVFEHDNNILN